MKVFCLVTSAVWLSLSPLGATAQDGTPFREQVGEYTFIYSAVRSDALPAEVARNHGLPAHSSSVLLNVTVQQEGANIPASIDARAINLAKQTRAIEMQETEANGFISYIGVVDVADREVLDFQLAIVPQGATESISLEFRAEFAPIPETREAVEDVQ